MIAEKGLTVQVGDLFFDGTHFEDEKISEEINEISAELPINTCELYVINGKDIISDFEKGKIVKVYFNGKLKVCTVIADVLKTDISRWTVFTESLVSLLDDKMFYGDVYESKNIVELFNKITEISGVEFEIEEILHDKVVNGFLGGITCREAVEQICFAIGAVADSSESEKIKIKALNDSVAQTIDSTRIFEKPRQEKKQEILKALTIDVPIIGKLLDGTANRITLSTLKQYKNGDIVEINLEEPYGEYILVRFNNYSGNYSRVVISGQGIYGAIEVQKISAFGFRVKFIDVGNDNEYDFGFEGYKYEMYALREKNIQNPYTTNSLSATSGSITDATLLTENNLDFVVDRCLKYYAKDNKICCQIVEGKKVEESFYKYGEVVYGAIKYGEEKPAVITYDTPIQLGDMLTVDLQDSGIITKRLTKQVYSLKGNTIVKDVVLE